MGLDFRKSIEFKESSIGKIPKTWDVCKLEDYVEIKGRIGWKGLKVSEYTMDGPFIVGGLQIIDGKVLWNACAHISQERYDESPEIKLQENDILITKDGTIGKLAYIANVHGQATIASHIHLIRSKSNRIIQRFLFYYFNSPKFHSIVEGKISGSVIAALTQADINKAEFPLPPINEQKAIAKILSDLDSKIELNQKMNKTLEAIAQAIFKHWFIDFEFPNEEGKPYKSSGEEMVDSDWGEIPKGWQVKNFKDIVNLTMGVSPKGNSYNTDGFGVPLLNGAADFSNGMIEPKKFTTKPVKTCKEGDLLFCIRATIGNLTYSDKEYCIGRGVAALSPVNKIFKEYSYFTLEYGLRALISKASGSVIRGLSKDDISLYKVLVPSDKIMAEFHLLVSSMFSRIRYLKIETHCLSNLKDSLLPRLISGKIRVPLEE